MALQEEFNSREEDCVQTQSNVLHHNIDCDFHFNDHYYDDVRSKSTTFDADYCDDDSDSGCCDGEWWSEDDSTDDDGDDGRCCFAWPPLQRDAVLVGYRLETEAASDPFDEGAAATTADELDALFLAAGDGRLETVKRFGQDHGGRAMMDAENQSGLRALHFASIGGHLDIVKYLVEEHDVNVDAADNDGWTVIHYATLAGRLDIIRYLVEVGGADCSAVDRDGWTPLHCAAQKGNLKVVKYLLEEQGVDENCVTETFGTSALHLATRECRLETVKYLVEDCGVDINRRDSNDSHVVHIAVRCGMLRAVSYFVERLTWRERFDAFFRRNDSGQTPYETAIIMSVDDATDRQRVVEYLHSFVAPLAIANRARSKLNPDLSGTDRNCAKHVLKLVDQIDDGSIHQVAHHILSYLCLSDVKP